MNKIITAIIGLVAVTALVLSIGNAVGGNTQLSLGTAANTRFPNGLNINSTGTSTLKLASRTALFGGCIELVSANAGASSTRIIASSTSQSNLDIAAGTCN